MHVTKRKRYGWNPDLPDHRDLLRTSFDPAAALPSKADLRGPLMPPVYDQGQLGSCTANAIAAAVDFMRAKQSEPFLTPSRLFIYYNERVAEGTVIDDSGAQIRDGIKSVASQGVCTESMWAYSDKAPGPFQLEPGADCYAAAVKFEAIKYARLSQDLVSMRQVLAGGDPFVFGFTVFDAFESDTVAKSGVVPMPAAADTPIGGHAVLAVGYDDSAQAFLVRNSWGASWGHAGYFTIPYDYLTSSTLADDFWVIQRES